MRIWTASYEDPDNDYGPEDVAHFATEELAVAWAEREYRKRAKDQDEKMQGESQDARRVKQMLGIPPKGWVPRFDLDRLEWKESWKETLLVWDRAAAVGLNGSDGRGRMVETGYTVSPCTVFESMPGEDE
jgi:hypothetical protein